MKKCAIFRDFTYDNMRKSITAEYFEILNHYRNKYGSKTVLLMQVGSFYELFEYQPDDDPTPNTIYGSIGEVVTELSEIEEFRCDKHVYKKQKPYSFNNPYSIGFPMVAYPEKREILLKYGYIIVLCDQQGVEVDPVTKKARREVVEVESNHVSLNSTEDSNKLVSIYLECHKSNNIFKDQNFICGISYIDILTGETGISEVYSNPNDASNALHEIYRFILSVKPKELILNVNKLPFKNDDPDFDDLSDKFKKSLYQSLSLDTIPHVIYDVNMVHNNYLTTNFHIEYFNRLYYSNNNSMILDEFGLERMIYGRTSFVLLINNALEHNKNIVLLLNKPTVSWLDEDKYLLLTHNAIEQLDLTEKVSSSVIQSGSNSNKENKTVTALIPLIDKTKTSMGRRFLHQRLLTPLTNSDEITLCYDQIEDLIQNKQLIPDFNKTIKKIKDLSKLHRKMKLHTLTPKELVQLMNSYSAIETIYEMIDSNQLPSVSKMLDRDKLLNMIRCRSYITTNLVLTSLQKCTLSTYQSEKCIEIPWLPGYSITYQEEQDNFFYHLKMYENNITFYKNELLKIIEYLKPHVSSRSKKESAPKLHSHKLKSVRGYNEDLNIETTKANGNSISKSYSQGLIDTNVCGQLNIYSKSSKSYISSPIIDSHLSNLKKNIVEYYKKIWFIYDSVITYFLHSDFYDYIVEFVSLFDFVLSNAQVSLENKYYKPEIVPGKKSYFEFKDLRHPIAEQLIFNEYISNDITLGLGDVVNYHGLTQKMSPYGMLLYGTNSCGKSTLAKAIGINLILAQAGCYTAGQLRYVPFKKIITRLSGNDNMAKGQSSFVVEMLELCTILRNTDENTLVIGDELSRGTENKSAIKLTIATIEYLIKRKSAFIFSTHLHELNYCSEVTSLPGKDLTINHLSVHYDKDNDVLVYDRKLGEGSGSDYYGIDVAESLHLPEEFIQRAREIQTEEEREDGKEDRLSEDNSNIIPTNKSRYNKDVYVDRCVLCDSTDNIETHHFKEQHTADENGFINHLHKNDRSNLGGLCRPCHTKLHSEKKMIVRKQTLNGSILMVVDDPEYQNIPEISK